MILCGSWDCRRQEYAFGKIAGLSARERLEDGGNHLKIAVTGKGGCGPECCGSLYSFDAKNIGSRFVWERARSKRAGSGKTGKKTVE